MSMHTPSAWHLDDETLRAYADGTPLPVLGPSVEAHLPGCPRCRERFDALVPDASVDLAWRRIRAVVEAPRRSAAERLLHGIGLSAESARLLGAVPALRGAWVLGVLVVTLFAAVAALFAGEVGMTLFLMVAPLAPVAGVASCFGGDADPSHELVTVTPYSALRLLLLRTLGVLATSVPVTVALGLALPGPAWLGIAWLTPAAAGVTLVLVLAPQLGATAPAATIGALWSFAVIAAARVGDPVAVVAPTMQLALLALTLAAGAALVLHYPSLDQLGRHP
jgi:hypothetical protein